MLYRATCLEIGLEMNVVTLDTWKLFLGDQACTPETTKDILVDGLHLDVRGNIMLADGIMECIKVHWPEILPDKLLEPIAWHDRVDPNNIVGSLFTAKHLI